MKHLNEQPPSPRSLRPDLPEPAEEAILKALAKRPSDRFATATALARAFDAGVKGQWAEELFPLPSIVPPDLDETQEQLPTAVPATSVPESSYQANQLVLGPAPAYNEAPVAFVPSQVSPVPVVRPQSRSRANALLLGTLVVVAILLLAVLVLLGVQILYSPFSPSGAGPKVHPTSTSGVPTRTGVTPTPSPRLTPTPSPGQTPTSTSTPEATPSPSPGATPSPEVTPSPSAGATPSYTVTPTPSVGP